jgi:hypothetical protein
MIASNSILSAFINGDAIIVGDGAVKNSAIPVDQQDGIFQEVLRISGKEEDMQTLLDQTNQKEGNQKETEVSYTQPFLSALSLLSMVGVNPSAPERPEGVDFSGIAIPVSNKTSWMSESFTSAVTDVANQENAIQAILANAYPIYVAQTTAYPARGGSEGHAAWGANSGNSGAIALADSDLDALITSLLLSKKKETVSGASLADLAWNHFNEAILTDADAGDSALAGFTFEEEGARGYLVSDLSVDKTAPLKSAVVAVGERASAVEPFFFAELGKDHATDQAEPGNGKIKALDGITTRAQLFEAIVSKQDLLQVSPSENTNDDSTFSPSLWKAWMGKGDLGNGQSLQSGKTVGNEGETLTTLFNHINLDSSALAQSAPATPQLTLDAIKSTSYAPDWRSDGRLRNMRL